MNFCYDFFWPTGFIIVFPLLNICRRFLVPFSSLSGHSKVFLVYSYLSLFFLHLQKLYIRFRSVWLKHSTMWTLMYYLYCCLYILFFQSFSLSDEVCTTHLKLFLNKQWLDFTPNLASPHTGILWMSNLRIFRAWHRPAYGFITDLPEMDYWFSVLALYIMVLWVCYSKFIDVCLFCKF